MIEEHIIIFSKNMEHQLGSPPKNIFKSKKHAYCFGIEKYGSDTFDLHIKGKFMGWSIKQIL